jgi:hypothetical protein
VLSTEETLRLTVAALMQRTGERQSEVGAGIGLTQAQVSKKQSGKVAWSLADVDHLAAHWGMSVLDLLAGPTHAAQALPAGRIVRGPATQTTIPVPAGPADATAALGPVPAAPASVTPPPVAGTPPEPAVPAASFAPPVFAEGSRPGAAVRPPAPAARTTAPEPGAPRPVRDVPRTQPAESHRDPAAPSRGSGPGSREPAAGAPHPQDAPAPPSPPRRRAAPAGPLADAVRGAVARVLREHRCDVDAARAALVRRAIPDVMALFAASRVGGRYEHSEFPPTVGLLQKRTQKGADQVWEGRPKWRAAELHAAARDGLVRLDVTALDMNAAYLAALKTHLPIGKLVHSEGEDAAFDPRRAGIHRVTPAPWKVDDLPSPLGARKEPGDLWVTEPTLRLLLHCARLGLTEAPVLHESWTSGASEGLLEKLRRALVEVRREALESGDDVAVEYVKSMYSKFVSTIGESSANRDIRRPDWMHIIRSQAFANLWRKAHKAHTSGLTVVEMSGTDELHVAGDWRQVFAEGRDLAQVKPKHAYILGGE